MTNAGILKTAKQIIQKLWKFIVFSAKFISTIIKFNIIQIIGNWCINKFRELSAFVSFSFDRILSVFLNVRYAGS